MDTVNSFLNQQLFKTLGKFFKYSAKNEPFLQHHEYIIHYLHSTVIIRALDRPESGKIRVNGVKA